MAGQRAARSPLSGLAPEIRDEVESLLRGLSAGFIFAIPTIYTMEVWWLGISGPAWRVALFFCLGYGLAVGLNQLSGFRQGAAWHDAFRDGLEAMAMGLLIAIGMLYLLGVAEWATAPAVVLKQSLALAVPISIGVSLARSELGEGGPATETEEEAASVLSADIRDLSLTVVGGLFVAISIAPTEEVVMIANQTSLPHWIMMVLLSLGLSYAMIFLAGFKGQGRRIRQQGLVQHPLVETIITYGLSLVVALVLLWFLGFIRGSDTPQAILAMMVVLGLPLSLGGAGARMIL